MVTEGQPLVLIDSAPYRAQLAAATANLEQAEASATNAKVAANRNRELSKQQARVAHAARRLRSARTFHRRAGLRGARAGQTARINLSYATVTSPIAGRAGRMRVLEGALVGQGEATLLTTVEQVDPIYVFFDQPASDFERLLRAQAAGSVNIAEGNLAGSTAGAPRRHLLRREGHARFLRLHRESGHRRGGIPRPHRQSGAAPVAGHVRERAAHGGRAQQRLPGAAARGATRWTGSLCAGRRRQTARSLQKRVETVAVVGNNWVISSGLDEGDQVVVVRHPESAARQRWSSPAPQPRRRKLPRPRAPATGS